MLEVEGRVSKKEVVATSHMNKLRRREVGKGHDSPWRRETQQQQQFPNPLQQHMADLLRGRTTGPFSWRRYVEKEAAAGRVCDHGWRLEERFLVKWKNLSHLHVTWETWNTLVAMDPRASQKIRRYIVAASAREAQEAEQTIGLGGGGDSDVDSGGMVGFGLGPSLGAGLQPPSLPRMSLASSASLSTQVCGSRDDKSRCMINKY